MEPKAASDLLLLKKHSEFIAINLTDSYFKIFSEGNDGRGKLKINNKMAKKSNQAKSIFAFNYCFQTKLIAA